MARQDAGAGAAKFLRQRLQALRAAGAEHQRRTGRREFPADAEPDATGGAGDKNNLLKSHGGFSPLPGRIPLPGGRDGGIGRWGKTRCLRLAR